MTPFENNAVALQLIELMMSGQAAGSIKRLEALITQDVRDSDEWRDVLSAFADLKILLAGKCHA